MNKLCRLLLLLTLLACLLIPAGASAVTGAQIAALRGERSYPQALDLPDALSVAAQNGGVMQLSAETGYPQPDENKIRRKEADIEIARRLNEHQSYSTIQKEMGVSSKTIAKVSRNLSEYSEYLDAD